MKFQNKLLYLLVVVQIIMQTNAKEAQCDLINTSTTFDIISPAFSSVPAFSSIDLFDSTLGTLNSVSVDISGIVRTTGTSMQHGVIYMGEFVPYEYYILSQVDLGFSGAFDLDSYSGPIQGWTPGDTTYVPTTTSFNFSFEFDGTTDLVGSTVFSTSGGFTGGVVDGFLDNFIASGPSTTQLSIWQTYANTTSIAGSQPGLLAQITGGLVYIEYDYTPILTQGPGIIGGVVIPPGSTVPEPATMLLFGTGLLGLVGIRRRKKA